MTTHSAPDPRWTDPPVDAVELRFGNAIMPLRREELARLRQILAERVTDHVPDGESTAEHTVLWLGDEGIGVRFTRDESRRLLTLVEQTEQRIAAEAGCVPGSRELAREAPVAMGACSAEPPPSTRPMPRRASARQGGIA